MNLDEECHGRGDGRWDSCRWEAGYGGKAALIQFSLSALWLPSAHPCLPGSSALNSSGHSALLPSSLTAASPPCPTSTLFPLPCKGPTLLILMSRHNPAKEKCLRVCVLLHSIISHCPFTSFLEMSHFLLPTISRPLPLQPQCCPSASPHLSSVVIGLLCASQFSFFHSSLLASQF